MLRRTLLRRPRSALAARETCAFCEARSVLRPPPRRYAGYWQKARSTNSKESRAEGRIVSQSEMAQKRALEEQASTPRADVLKAASDAGFLKMDPQRALAFLAEFQRLGKNPGARALLSLCDDTGIQLWTLTSLARVLLRSTVPAQRVTGRRLLLSVSAAGDVSATIRLLNTALKHGQLQAQELIPVRARLMSLVKDDKHPLAMVLLAQMLVAEGQHGRALPLLEAATSQLSAAASAPAPAPAPAEPGSRASDPGEDADEPAVTPPWTALGNLRLRLGDPQGAREAFEVGAFKGDDPAAYFYLAAFEAAHTAAWLEYTTKAAASGHVEAAFGLGRFYSLPDAEAAAIGDAAVRAELRRRDGTGERRAPLSGRMRWAVEWLSVAAAACHMPSILYSARLAWRLGARAEAVAVLNTVLKGDGEVVREIRKDQAASLWEAQALADEWMGELGGEGPR